MALNQNQFAQIPVQGMMDMKKSFKVISAEIDASELGSLVAGQAVKLVDSAGGVPKVIAVAANTDTVLGLLVFNIKNQSFKAGDAVEIATGFDDVMYCTASAAVARGAKLMVVVSGNKVVTATAGKPILGWAFDKAAADGDLIRVSLACPSFFTA